MTGNPPQLKGSKIELLRVQVAIILISYVLQNYLIRTSDSISWLIVLPAWSFLFFSAGFAWKRGVILFSSIFWIIALLIYASASLYQHRIPSELPFFIANGVFFIVWIQAFTRVNLPFGAAYISKVDGVLAILVALISLYWVNLIRVEQTYLWNAAYELRAANYLIVSDLLVIYSILRMDNGRIVTNFFWLVLALVTLTLLGSRSTMVLGGGALLSRYIFVIGHRNRILAIVAAISAILSILLLLKVFSDSVLFRALSLQELSGDASFIGRQAIFMDWLHSLREHPSCLVMPCLPQQGGYVHNLLSMIEFFGLFGILLIASSFFILFIAWRRGWVMPFRSLFLLSFAQIIIARAFGAFYYPIILAYAAMAAYWLVMENKKKRNHRAETFTP